MRASARLAARIAGPPAVVAGPSLSRRLPWSAGVALVYHRVGDPAGDPAGELVPALATRLFEAQLRYLRRSYRLVVASELPVAVLQRRRGDRFPVAVTFDDDLDAHVETAMPILRQHGVPATFFVCGASLDAPFAFWWEHLQAAVDRGRDGRAALRALPPGLGAPLLREGRSALRRVGDAIERLDPDARSAIAATLARELGDDPPDAGLRAGRLATLAGAGFEIGFHTLRHDPLTTLDDRRLEQALRDGRPELGRRLGTEPAIIAYPHGRADARVAAAARAAGYAYGFTGRHQAVLPGSDPHLLGRITVPPGSVGALAVRILRALCAPRQR